MVRAAHLEPEGVVQHPHHGLSGRFSHPQGPREGPWRLRRNPSRRSAVIRLFIYIYIYMRHYVQIVIFTRSSHPLIDVVPASIISENVMHFSQNKDKLTTNRQLGIVTRKRSINRQTYFGEKHTKK